MMVPQLLLAQVVNGSFEDNSGPILTGWTWTCGAESFPNAPSGGGNWCIKVLAGTLEGSCKHGVAYQKIPGIVPEQNYELSGYEYSENCEASIYFGSIHDGVISYWSGATVSSGTIWTKMSIQATFQLQTGDTAIIALKCSTTSGPESAYGYFDLISLKSMVDIPELQNRPAIKFSPNPVHVSATLEINGITDFSNTYIDIVEITGRKAVSLKIDKVHTEIPRGNLSKGLYFLHLRNKDTVVAKTKFVVTD